MKNIKTYNSKTCIYGNRRNLTVNYDTKELFYYGCNVFNKGTVINGLGIREVNRKYKKLLSEGYKSVSHEVAREW